MNAPLSHLGESSVGARASTRFELEGVAPGRGFLVERAEVRERLNTPTLAVVELRCLDRDFDSTALIGRNARLTLTRDDEPRSFVGLVVATEHMEVEDWRPGLRVQLAPALLALEHTRRSRIFQGRSVPDILEDVLGSALQPYGRRAELNLRERYPARETVAQYRESDLDFVDRLCEEASISYFFEHEGETETLVLTDYAGALEAVPASNRPVPIVAGASRGTDEVQAIHRLRFEDRIGPTSFRRTAYDWTRPALALAAQANASADGPAREVVETDRGGAPTGYTGEAYTGETGSAWTRREAHIEAVRGRLARGVGTVGAFRPGVTFSVVDHPRPELNRDYSVVQVEHRWEADGSVEGSAFYANEFECVPEAVCVGPERRTARPRVLGCQTAVVVAPAGQPLATDVHGRVRVHFHWDPDGPNERSSAWIRVAQGWAGEGLGVTFVPRAGMEVVVSFEDGDPDRPLIIGCVRNGTNRTHHTLPEHATRSVIRTETVGGDGFNELYFEDRSGAEAIALHAQRDLLELVLHDHKTEVRRDQTNLVRRHHKEHVGGNQSLIVAGKRTKTVKGLELNQVHLTRSTLIGLAESLAVGGARTTTVALSDSLDVVGARSVKVRRSLTETVGGAHRATVRGTQTLRVARSKTETVGGKSEVQISGPYVFSQGKKGGSTQVTARSGDLVTHADKHVRVFSKDGDIRLQAGKSSLELKHDGTIVLSGVQVEVHGRKRTVARTDKSFFAIKEDSMLSEAKKLTLKGKSGVAIKSKKITHN